MESLAQRNVRWPEATESEYAIPYPRGRDNMMLEKRVATFYRWYVESLFPF